MSPIRAWHFCANDLRLGYGDYRKIVVGETLSVEGTIQLCEHGLHGSVNVLDALAYAPDTILCAVEISGDVQEEENKLVGRHRKTLAMADVTDTLLFFARKVAKSVAHLWDCPDTVLRFLESGEGAAEAEASADAAALDAEAAADAAAALASARAADAALAAAALASARAADAAAALAAEALAAAAWAEARSARSAREALAADAAAARAARATHNELLLDLLKTNHPELFLGEITQ